MSIKYPLFALFFFSSKNERYFALNVYNKQVTWAKKVSESFGTTIVIT